MVVDEVLELVRVPVPLGVGVVEADKVDVDDMDTLFVVDAESEEIAEAVAATVVSVDFVPSADINAELVTD